ncbi:MAG TPA: hypothetical protein PKO04_11320, partial [Smithellaceae bacterium]|nr:hypothetical protein [Smithellaceae bacterium]
AKEVQFEGNLRFLDRDAAAGDKIPGIFLVRSLEGELYIVSIPSDDELKRTGAEAYKKIPPLDTDSNKQ